MNKAIFIDKDGTLIYDVPYNVNPDLIRFEKYALESMLRLQKEGFLIVIISNQPGVGLHLFKEEALKEVENTISGVFRENGIELNGFYYCPHSPDSSCTCRKPQSGLLLQAAKNLLINLSSSWMIGDILNDVEAGNNCGTGTILIDNGNETEWKLSLNRQPDYKVQNLKEASDRIVGKKYAHEEMGKL